MKKLFINLLSFISFFSAITIQARITFELWNKSKTPFYIALVDRQGKFILPEALQGRFAKQDKPIKLQELKPGNAKGNNTNRITLDDTIYNSTGAHLIIFDKQNPGEIEWRAGLPSYQFKAGKDIYIRIKDNVKNLTDLLDSGFGPQMRTALTMKGPKAKTHSGLPLKNNVRIGTILNMDDEEFKKSTNTIKKMPPGALRVKEDLKLGDIRQMRDSDLWLKTGTLKPYSDRDWLASWQSYLPEDWDDIVEKARSEGWPDAIDPNKGWE